MDMNAKKKELCPGRALNERSECWDYGCGAIPSWYEGWDACEAYYARLLASKGIVLEEIPTKPDPEQLTFWDHIKGIFK